MSNYVHLDCPDFFRQFYNKCIPVNKTFDDCLFIRDSFSGIGVESKRTNCLFGFIRWLNPFVTMDLESNVAYFRKNVESKLELYNAVVSSPSLEEKQALAKELIAMAKCCHFVQHILKAVAQKRVKRSNNPSYSLCTAKDYFKGNQGAAMERAATLLKRSRLELALEHGFVKEAISWVTSEGELEGLKNNFPHLLKSAFKHNKYNFVMQLIALGADYSALGLPLVRLLGILIFTKHEQGTIRILDLIAKREDLLPVIQQLIHDKIGEARPQARSLIDAGHILLFIKKLLPRMPAFQASGPLTRYCEEEPVVFLRKAATILRKSPFLVAIENCFIDQAHDLEPTYDELLSARVHFQQLLQGAATRSNYELLFALLHLGADPSKLQIALDELLCMALKRDNFEVALKLVLSIQDQKNLLKLLQSQKENTAYKSLEELRGLCKRYFLLERLVQRVMELRPECKTGFSQFQRELWEVLLELIGFGADVTALDIAKELLLKKALKAAHEAALVQLVRQGASIQSRFRGSGFSNSTLLHIACKNRFYNLAQLLYENRLDINDQDDLLMTPLHYASSVLDAKMVRWLLANGADPSKKNREARFALCSQDLQAFHSEEALNAFYFELLTLKPEAKLIVEEAKKKNKNPLEIAFYLQDRSLAVEIASLCSKHEFACYLDALEKKYPLADISLVEYSPYTLSEEHYSRAVSSTNVEEPLHDVSLDLLLSHLEGLDDLYRESIKEIIEKVNLKKVFLGTPRKDPALSEFYQIVRYCLQHIILKLEELKKSPDYKLICKEVFEQLHRASSLCGAQLRTVPTLLFLKLCKGIVLQGDALFYQSLSEFRGLLLEGIFENDPDGVHSWDHFVTERGEKYGIPGFGIVKVVADDFLGDRDDMDEIESDFQSLYTPQNIVESCIMPKVLDGELRDSLIDWHKNHLPEKWQKAHFDELLQKACAMAPNEMKLFLQEEVGFQTGDTPEVAIQRERLASYLGTWVYDSSTNQLKRRAVVDVLLQLGVLKASFQEDTQEPENLLYWFVKIPGGFFSRLATLFKF